MITNSLISKYFASTVAAVAAAKYEFIALFALCEHIVCCCSLSLCLYVFIVFFVFFCVVPQIVGSITSFLDSQKTCHEFDFHSRSCFFFHLTYLSRIFSMFRFIYFYFFVHYLFLRLCFWFCYLSIPFAHHLIGLLGNSVYYLFISIYFDVYE